MLMIFTSLHLFIGAFIRHYHYYSEQELEIMNFDEVFAALINYVKDSGNSIQLYNQNRLDNRERCFHCLMQLLISSGHFESHFREYTEMLIHFYLCSRKRSGNIWDMWVKGDASNHTYGASDISVDGCYGNGFYVGEYVGGEMSGDGVWIHKNGKVKGEGRFYSSLDKDVIGWACSGKIFDTESNTLVFEGEFGSAGWISGKQYYPDGSIYIGTFKNNLRDGLGSYTNSTYTATLKGLWCEGKKNWHFIEKTVGAGQSALYYEDDVLCGGLAYKRPRTMSLFFNSLKKRFFKISEGVLFYYSGHLDLIEKGHLDLQYYDVYDSKSKRVVRKEPYSIVLRCVNTVGVFEKREIVLYFEEWKDNWPQLKETWLKLIRDGIEYAVLKNKKESKAMSGFTQAYEAEMEISDASAPDSAPSEGGGNSLEDRS